MTEMARWFESDAPPNVGASYLLKPTNEGEKE